jgi:hypothetical protein
VSLKWILAVVAAVVLVAILLASSGGAPNVPGLPS